MVLPLIIAAAGGGALVIWGGSLSILKLLKIIQRNSERQGTDITVEVYLIYYQMRTADKYWHMEQSTCTWTADLPHWGVIAS